MLAMTRAVLAIMFTFSATDSSLVRAMLWNKAEYYRVPPISLKKTNLSRVGRNHQACHKNDPLPRDTMGRRFALSQDTAVVGAFLNDANFVKSGAACVYEGF